MAPPPAPRRSPSPKKQAFATTWWGQAWIAALEDRAQLDPNRLPRGRAYARRNRVLGLTLEPGAITAQVIGTRATPYRVIVRVRTFTKAEWRSVVEAIASRAAHAAALLDGELSPAVVEDAAAAGVELLPGAGELQPRCSCPDWADPCKHAAAVCYLVAPALDADPFALFALRGLDRDALIAAVRRARSASDRAPRVPGVVGSSTVGSMARAPEPGIGAQQLWLDWAQRLGAGTARLPGAAPLVERAVLPRALPPPADAEGQEVDVVDLARLAADAAARAWNMLAGMGDSGLGLDAGHDMARRAAAALARGNDAFEQLAANSGVRPRDLLRRAVAWRDGGAFAVDLITGQPAAAAWSPPAGLLAETAAQLQSESAGELRLRVGGDRLTLVGQRAALHPGPDGRWYRLERRHGHLELTRPPAKDPVDLLSD